jgi:hypothetical protein
LLSLLLFLLLVFHPLPLVKLVPSQAIRAVPHQPAQLIAPQRLCCPPRTLRPLPIAVVALLLGPLLPLDHRPSISTGTEASPFLSLPAPRLPVAVALQPLPLVPLLLLTE